MKRVKFELVKEGSFRCVQRAAHGHVDGERQCAPRFRTSVALGLLLLMLAAAPSHAVTSYGDGWNPTLTADGHSLFYWATYDKSPQLRRKRTLATGVDVAAPLPTFPSSAPPNGGHFAVTPSERFIAYTTYGSTLTGPPWDQNNKADVYVYDTINMSLDWASLSNAGQEGFNASDTPSIASDGRYVAFRSSAPNLVAGDANGSRVDIFVRDRCVSDGTTVPSCTPSTQLVSVGAGGIQADGDCDLQAFGGAHSISADGCFVVFDCWGSNLQSFVPGHACNGGCGNTAVFLRDRCISNGATVPSCTPATELISLGPGGAFANGDSDDAVISGDGTRIAFMSYATDITGDPETGGNTEDVFLYDRDSQTTRRLSTPPDDGDDVFGPGELSISHDGRQVSFKLQGLHHLYDYTMSLWADCAAIQPTCGDSAIEPGCEECDDGNVIDGDGCDSNCTVTRCGNGVTTAGEQCDTGDSIDGDGCDSNCTFTTCGNDIRTAGEICDDGNVASGDGCSSTCTIEPDQLTPGGPKVTDCEFEWMPRPQPLKKKGIPKNAVTCVDDDPTCDIGGEAGDKLCVFRLAFCVNVTDPRLMCTPIDLAAVAVTKPKALDFDHPTDYITAFNRGSVEFNLQQLGGVYTGHCEKPPVNVGDACADDFDCDDVGGDGRCSKPVFEFVPPLTATNLCSDYADFVVALKERAGVYKKASMSISLKATASNDANGKPRNVDKDTIKLTCLPTP